MPFTLPLLKAGACAVAVVALSMVAAEPAVAEDWNVDHERSSLGFTVVNSGTELTGQFTRWAAEIKLDPNDAEDAEISVAVDLTSVSTGNGQADATLATTDWFDTASEDTARFEADSVRVEGESYIADGTLDLRGAAVPVSLVFVLAFDGDSARAEGGVILNRMDYGIGAGSDASGGMVGLEVAVRFIVVATREE